VVDTEGPRRDAVRDAVARLEEMIVKHDVTFMLTDTRESRWLPTMLAAHHDKLVINCALGFDSFLVMRHGAKKGGEEHEDGKGEKELAAAAAAAAEKGAAGKEEEQEQEAMPRQPRLGCYFCNDIVAPADSTRDRTLDQQCTVTRPGLALMASAIGVELLVGLLHHPLGHHAPADDAAPVFQACERRLGLLPHQIRGYLTHFSNVVAHGPAFQQCTACSEVIRAQYAHDGFSFLHRVFNDPSYLEDLSGITELNKAAEDMDMDDFAMSSDDEEGLM
jgi:ubiquitin-like modifier-activating enzyme ATG7